MFKRLIRNFLNELKSKPIGQIALVILLILLILTIIAPLIVGDPNRIDVLNKNIAPNAEYIFGTDRLGRDYFARALYGGRVSLLVGISSVIISSIIGTVVGITAGYFGGWIDNLIMRIIDILMSVPNFFLIVILNTYLKPGIQNVIIIMGLLSWMSLARLIRSETMSIKNSDFVSYARAVGVPVPKIMIRHLLTNVFPLLIVTATLNVGSAILTESSLSFFGLGVSQPTASWGAMLSDARAGIFNSLHLGFFPGVLILLTVLSFNILGDIMRNSIDVRSNRLSKGA